MNQEILLVDDEPNLLDGLKRMLGNEFSVTTANGGENALRRFAESGPYAVVISDMRMPGMDGIELLRAVRERWPETTRLMLTGHADIQTAIDAVNEGYVFRFLTKPCPETVLRRALHSALAQFRLIVAEKELLEKTLYGSIKVLTEILALVNPVAFSRATRLHRTVKLMVQHLPLNDAWRYEVAALLSQIGCAAFDTETVEAIYSGADLPAAERERFHMHPSIAFELLSPIPRLESVAAIIAGQYDQRRAKEVRSVSALEDPQELGVQLLKIAMDFDQFLMRGASAEEALEAMKRRPDEYYSPALAALEVPSADGESFETQQISIREVSVGMVLNEDLRSADGMLRGVRGQEITYPLLIRLRSLHQKSPFPSTICVQVPSFHKVPAAGS